MKQETRKLDWSNSDHHFIILNETDMAELVNGGVICTEFNPDGSFSYIILEEYWNRYVEEGEQP